MRRWSAPTGAASPRSPRSIVAVPVIAAVQGFCLGGGVGLAGNADIVIASDDATFGLPEVDRGALGAATHLARLVPQPLMRAMVYTCRTVTADQLLAFGTVLEVVPPGELRRRRTRLAERDRGQGSGASSGWRSSR